jgi:hypothetical protein
MIFDQLLHLDELLLNELDSVQAASAQAVFARRAQQLPPLFSFWLCQR